MILKPGVNPKGLRPEILIAVIVANEVWSLHGHNLVITSITDGQHGENSYHYDGLAIDCRTHYFDGIDEIHEVARELRDRLGSLYDVVVEQTHIHIEFDERRAGK
jgi:hypothetical protein